MANVEDQMTQEQRNVYYRWIESRTSTAALRRDLARAEDDERKAWREYQDMLYDIHHREDDDDER